MEPTMSEEDSSLTTQCLALCQALASQGKAFKFFIKIGSNFSFSLDNRDKSPSTKVEKATSTNLEGRKKKPSPSSLKRNATRRETFLGKQKPPTSPEKAATEKAAAEKAATEKAAAKKAAAEKAATEKAAAKKAAAQKAAAEKAAADKAALEKEAADKTAAEKTAKAKSHNTRKKKCHKHCYDEVCNFYCDKCKITLADDQQELKRHLEEKHRLFLCEDCGKKCSSRQGLKDHIANQVTYGGSKFSFPTCPD
jgi:type IV secretory pathway VirB10-like protein